LDGEDQLLRDPAFQAGPPGRQRSAHKGKLEPRTKGNVMAKASKAVWTGRVISTVVGLLFVFSAVMKFVGGDEMEKGMGQMGLPSSILLPLAVVELTCAVIYLVPATTVLGAILLTGYLGGAILTHWRVGDVFYTHIVLGVLLWVGVALRDGRMWTLIPVRRRPGTAIGAAFGGNG
jgi:hypothetical protein